MNCLYRNTKLFLLQDLYNYFCTMKLYYKHKYNTFKYFIKMKYCIPFCNGLNYPDTNLFIIIKHIEGCFAIHPNSNDVFEETE